MGVARAPVVGSGCAPAWIASVAKPGMRSVMAGPRPAGTGRSADPHVGLSKRLRASRLPREYVSAWRRAAVGWGNRKYLLVLCLSVWTQGMSPISGENAVLTRYNASCRHGPSWRGVAVELPKRRNTIGKRKPGTGGGAARLGRRSAV